MTPADRVGHVQSGSVIGGVCDTLTALLRARQAITVAGLPSHTLGSIPKPGESVTLAGYRWTAVDVDGPRITKVKVERAGQ